MRFETGPMKKMNWKKINPGNISETSVWVSCQSDSFSSDELFNDLKANFSLKLSKNVSTKSPAGIYQVLDEKAVQNILIFKKATLKNKPIEQTMQAILNCENAYEYS